jgi:hypothetical protein
VLRGTGGAHHNDDEDQIDQYQQRVLQAEHQYVVERRHFVDAVLKVRRLIGHSSGAERSSRHGIQDRAREVDSR